MNAKKKAARDRDDQTPDFEQAYAELERVVQSLEASQLGLSESLKLYEQGVRSLKVCYQALESAERKIELLTGVSSEGEAQTEAFDDEASDKTQPVGRRRAGGGGTRTRSAQRSAADSDDEVDDGDGVDDDARLF